MRGLHTRMRCRRQNENKTEEVCFSPKERKLGRTKQTRYIAIRDLNGNFTRCIV